jgi:hypothetical protein
MRGDDGGLSDGGKVSAMEAVGGFEGDGVEVVDKVSELCLGREGL